MLIKSFTQTDNGEWQEGQTYENKDDVYDDYGSDNIETIAPGVWTITEQEREGRNRPKPTVILIETV